MEQQKKCRKCNIDKVITDYYTHRQMPDGHLNICIECTKSRVSLYGKTERGRINDSNRNKKEKRKKWLVDYQKNYLRKKYIKKYKARSMYWSYIKNKHIQKQSCEICNTDPSVSKIEAHHDDYDKPLDVRWLCIRCHKEWHKYNNAKNEF